MQINRKDTVSFVLALATALAVSGGVYYMLFLNIFDVFGVESIQYPEGRDLLDLNNRLISIINY